MFVEQIRLTNFRCFGPATVTIDLTASLTAFVGANGAGKTAALLALQRMFGITGDQRRLRRRDFHIPTAETAAPIERVLVLEAILAFPEFNRTGTSAAAIPDFFHHMAADAAGQMKCRLRLEGEWTDDGSLEGAIEEKYQAIRALGTCSPSDCVDLKAQDRARIQMIYVPASRDGASQVTAFLRGRLWRAVHWSDAVKKSFKKAGAELNDAFGAEPSVDVVVEAVKKRWREVHTAGTDATPVFRPIDLRFQEFIRQVEVVFKPDEAGRERALDDLSDGQRSLFHLAMTSAVLDVEEKIFANPRLAGFQPGGVALPALTLIAVEEPENNLAPFYLSRIVKQIEDLTRGARAQALVSSHSPSIMARVDPSQVRHFRLEPDERSASVNSIRLPPGSEEASKFVREAVRTYPELYFARFVVLGEGASEEVVLPRLAEAMGLDIDRSFVAVVPLGGRHVNHLWRLLTDLDIPHATLLDLDWGRKGGGWGRIKTACEQLIEVGIPTNNIFASPGPSGPKQDLATFDALIVEDFAGLTAWANALRRHNVFFCTPLDLDYSMLCAFPDAYTASEEGRDGPSAGGNLRKAVFGEAGRGDLYSAEHETTLLWYRYLFLGRGKPSTHVRVLSSQTSEVLDAGAPEELRAVLSSIVNRIGMSSSPKA